MNRLHVHLSVKDLEKSTRFYNDLFGVEPSKTKADYVKWSLTNPPLNFAISTHGKAGINHLGIEAEDQGELDTLYQRADQLQGLKLNEGETVCCYSRSIKSWVKDPQGINWELFHSLNDENVYKESGKCCITGNCG
ncbi:MAG: VOC family protein [Gammaproteobacteria bacterium]|nr:VOC family protein [Gammaproteobacteria bacterium]MDH5652475.1 VOC family protein [Gammaproteobacteria bacterium]